MMANRRRGGRIPSRRALRGNFGGMNGSSELGLDRLIQDGAWLRRFVGSLVASQDVDDVVQSTWLAAVEEPGAVRGSVASWLRGVSTNVARMLHRSRHRGARALGRLHAAGEAPATADVVAGLEVQRAVSEALLALPEPTRTILVLRYQQGLSPATIAPRVGLKVDAVRQRLHRGREAVRERLHERFGADWRGSAAIAAFVRRPEVAATPAFGAAILVGIVAAATLVLAILPASIDSAAPPQHEDAMVIARRDVPAAADVANATAVVAPTERALVASAAQEPSTPAASSPSPGTTATNEVHGRLVAEEDGSPIAGATIKRSRTESTTSGSDGRFVLACEPNSKEMIWFRAEARCPRWCEHRQPSADLGDISLTRGYEVRGHVVCESGAPIPNLRFETRHEGEIPDGSIGYPCTTDSAGAFTVAWLLPAGTQQLRSPSGWVFENPELVVVAGARNDFVLRARRLRSVTGVAVDADGRPCANVDLTVYPTLQRDTDLFISPAATSKADGSFEIFDEREDDAAAFLDVGDHGAHDLVGPRIPFTWETRGVRIVVRPRIPVRLLVVEAESGNPIVQFAAFARVMRGASTLESGESSVAERGSRYAFPGLPAGAHVVVFTADPEHVPVVVVVDESMRAQAEVRVGVPKLQPFAVELVDARGAPVAVAFDVIDRRGIAAPDGWSDYVAGTQRTQSFVPVSPFRVSGGSTDSTGKGTLLAPTDPRDLAICVQRGERRVWLPVVLPAPGKALRLVVPD